jgi:biopolymer transport protein ExbD
MAITFRKVAQEDDALLAEINTTPLVDVMLVLLIIFLITIPAVNSTVAINLPKESNHLRQTQVEHIVISVDRAGGIYWVDARLPDADALRERLAQAAQRSPQPEVHIRGDGQGGFAGVGRVVLAAQQAGITRIGFITEPPARN